MFAQENVYSFIRDFGGFANVLWSIRFNARSKVVQICCKLQEIQSLDVVAPEEAGIEKTAVETNTTLC